MKFKILSLAIFSVFGLAACGGGSSDSSSSSQVGGSSENEILESVMGSKFQQWTSFYFYPYNNEDEIKTIDDAINEASIAMRKDKQERFK